jgi:polyhydroxybutyrate depolymerase
VLRSFILPTFLVLSSVSCSTDEGSGPPLPDGGEIEHDGGDAAVVGWTAGDYPPDRQAQTYLELAGVPGQGDRSRGYKVHVPAGYTATSPVPVLYSFHGYRQNAVMFTVSSSRLVELSDQNGFVLVIPNGVQEDGYGGSWNGGTCCGSASAKRLDDVALIRAIHAQVSEHLKVDQTRVYATGLSNGGFLSHRLACEASDLFAAIAPLAGTIGTTEFNPFPSDEDPETNKDPDLKACSPSHPVAVLMMHGTMDKFVSYANMKPSLEHWASVNGCQMTTSPAVQPASGGDTTCVTYNGCSAGVEVTACTVDQGGHCWFGDPACGTGAPGIGNMFVGNDSNFLDASSAVWNFVSRFHR